jgi:hypothetical protein
MKKLKPNDGMTLEDAKAAASDLEAILLNFDRFYAGGTWNRNDDDNAKIVRCVTTVRQAWKLRK